MFSLFRKKKTMQQRIRESIDGFNEENHMHDMTLPEVDAPPATHLGEDVDLVALVQRLAPKQIQNIQKELEELENRRQKLMVQKTNLQDLLDSQN